MQAINSQELRASIPFLFCNRDLGEKTGSDRFISFAQQQRLEVLTLSSRKFVAKHPGKPRAVARQKYDEAVYNLITHRLPVDYLMCAGYMLIAPLLCLKMPMLNLHPALPDGPAGTWKQVARHLAASKATESGITVHLATPNLDAGPAVAYCRFRLPADFGADQDEAIMLATFRRVVLPREQALLVGVLKEIASDTTKVPPSATSRPRNLTRHVEDLLARNGIVAGII